MNPFLWPNDYVVIIKTKMIRRNDVVVLELEEYGKVIKRVKEIVGNEVILTGDNSRIQSSSCERSHSKEKILGKVIFVLKTKDLLPRYIYKHLKHTVLRVKNSLGKHMESSGLKKARY